MKLKVIPLGKDIWIRFKLETFQLRLKTAGKLSKFFEILKDHFNPKRNPRLHRSLKRIARFFKKRANLIVQNKNDWMERIHLGPQFVVHDHN